MGRAVDIHALDSSLVIDSRDVTSETYEVVEWLASRPDIREIGSPWLFEDVIVRTFTNQVHQDHVHIGVHPEGVVNPSAEPSDES